MIGRIMREWPDKCERDAAVIDATFAHTDAVGSQAVVDGAHELT